MTKARLAIFCLMPLLLVGCTREGELTTAGVMTTRTACPVVAIPAATGDVTLFDPPTSRDASAIDIEASMTNVRNTCSDSGDKIVASTTFEVQAQRRDAAAAREVVIPYFATVVQGSNNVVSKSVGRVALRFEAGSYRASATGSATGSINRSAATLPADIERQITRDRKPGEADAALDPMADPKVRAAVQRASFEFLVGFQLTADQLAYNATR